MSHSTEMPEERLSRLKERYLTELQHTAHNPDLASYLAECVSNEEKDLFVELAKTMVGLVADLHVIERHRLVSTAV